MRKFSLFGYAFLSYALSCYGIGQFEGFVKLEFPTGSTMGLFLALAIPLDLPNKNVFLAYNFEANYNLPSNATIGEYPPVIERNGRQEIVTGEGNNTSKPFSGIDRKFVYTLLESKITTHGFQGRPCLLRTICETALHSVTETNGVLGDIVHILFTPTSSKNTGLLPDYEEAERHGKTKNDCTLYHKNCTISILDLVSWLGNAL